MVDEWLREIKSRVDHEGIGMILVHNGIVRGTSKDGKKVRGMRLSYGGEKLDQIVSELKQSQGICDIKVWINEGELRVGDDIMYILVAGRIRKEVIPVFERLIERVKKEVVREEEIFLEV